MKKVISSLCLVLVVVNSYAQRQAKPSSIFTRAAYMKKSQNQRVGSVLLVVVGCTIGLVGSVASVVASAGGGPSGPPFPIVPVTLGAGCIAGSIVLSKASARNKQKALEASTYLEIQSVPAFQPGGVGFPGFLAMSWKIMLP